MYEANQAVPMVSGRSRRDRPAEAAPWSSTCGARRRLCIFLIAAVSTFATTTATAEDRIERNTATTHWAYAAPQRPQLPRVKNKAWIQQPLDAFILARLEDAGLAPSPQADRVALLRRVYLDLIGLPPRPADVDAFLASDDPNAYEHIVESLLASPQYGENWARHWLDLARYADSNGYQRDGHRQVWAYRDWVVEALNADMPFDRFTVEQIAGDLLPSPTLAQRIATGFHRGTTVNVEAGVDQEEDRVNAVIDRVNTTATVWLATTLACAQCHEHKYDPFSQEDYYQLFAFFNSTKIETVAEERARRQFVGPSLELPEPAERRSRRRDLQKRRERAERELAALKKTVEADASQLLTRFDQDPAALTDVTPALRELLTASRTNRGNSEELRPEDRAKTLKSVEQHLLSQDGRHKEIAASLERCQESLALLEPFSTLVMMERDEPRPTHVFKRGNFLNPGKQVERGVPRVFHSMQPEAPKNRLGLARWLVSRENPLVARAAVNRWWNEFFGRGIAPRLEDFGSQSEPPSHPQLLDWLATEFVDHGWSMKHMHRILVTSATYRQDSRIPRAAAWSAAQKADPENTLYWRGPRLRLEAEKIRDYALAVSGLLAPTMGGPPVRPPQPDGVWNVIGQVDNTYRTSTGRDRYRRSLYTVWRRSSPYPSFVNFDAPDRASCTPSRSRTNTPLQALTLLNDPVYVEVALELAVQCATAVASASPTAVATSSSQDRIREVAADTFRRCVMRAPTADELQLLSRVYTEERARFAADPGAARALVGAQIDDSDQPLRFENDPGFESDIAAWFFVTNALLNLDEVITKS